MEEEIRALQGKLDQDNHLLSALRHFETGRKQDAPWLVDLDALTRLLPEDTRLVGLQWQPAGLQLDLITPNPETIRGILEGSPEFKEIKFIGNLDRRENLARLTLEMRSKGAR